MSTLTYGQQDASYLQRVYGWLLLGLLITTATAAFSLNFGAPASVRVDEGIDKIVMVPPAVALVMEHPIITGLIFLTFALTVVGVRGKSTSFPLYVGFTAFTGLFVGPSLYIAQLKAAEGHTLSAHPVRDAAVLTLGSFVALSVYAAWSKKDFSAWGAALTTGCWVLVGAMVMNLFFGSTALELAISSAAVVVFSGFIIYDTKVVTQGGGMGSALGDAMNLYLDVLNLFLHVLRLLGINSKD